MGPDKKDSLISMEGSDQIATALGERSLIVLPREPLFCVSSRHEVGSVEASPPSLNSKDVIDVADVAAGRLLKIFLL